MAEEEEPTLVHHTCTPPLQTPKPFLEILCKSSGKVRRVAVGSEAAFALKAINRKLDAGMPLASFIEAVKQGEEPISFGPNVVLTEYGAGWRLETVVEEGFGKEKEKHFCNHVLTDCSTVRESQTIIHGAEGFEKEEKEEQLKEKQFTNADLLDSSWKSQPIVHEMEGFQKEKGKLPIKRQFTNADVTDYSTGWEFQTVIPKAEDSEEQPPKRQFTNGDLADCDTSGKLQRVIDEGFEKDKGDSLTENQVANVIDHATLPSQNVISLIQMNYVSGDEEEKDVIETSIIYPCTAETFTTRTIFEDVEDLVEWCKEAGRSIGAVVIISRSDRSESGRRPRVVLTCERSGHFRPKKPKDTTPLRTPCKRTRDVGSKKCNCPFKLKGYQRNEGGWEVTVACGTHNHPLADNPVGRAPARLTPEEQALVIELSEAGVKPREMLDVLRKKTPSNFPTISTIYNFRAKHRLTKPQPHPLKIEGEARNTMIDEEKNLDDHTLLEFG